MIVLVAATTTMRMYLLLTAIFDPSSLRPEVQRWSVALRVAGSSIWILLFILAITFLRQHTGIAALVLGLSIGGLVSTLIAEAAIDRKAFP
jgi:hypothetical protein